MTSSPKAIDTILRLYGVDPEVLHAAARLSRRIANAQTAGPIRVACAYDCGREILLGVDDPKTLVDLPKYDSDGELDYIQIAHAARHLKTKAFVRHA